ncbi:MAG: cytochrome c [SAR324 cluster bacterium]|nr:cytochrome c [SAR324 cluster bacterium]MDP7630115.1 cytochrome c [SAR324 cluster bacterium]
MTTHLFRWGLAGLALLLASGLHARTPNPIAGERIFNAAGGCGCHTAENGKPLSGGRPLKTPFGIYFSTNITPDPDTGIGGWSDADLLRAMREGIAPDGSHYFPVFPYTAFSKMTAEDVLHLKDYLFTLPAVQQSNRPHDVWFPFNLRFSAWGWKLVNFHPEPLLADVTRSKQWTRGRYLAEAVAHCGECHTPRNGMGALKADWHYAGSREGPEGEVAPNITPDAETGIGQWSKDDLTYLLETGMLPDGDFIGGLMSEAVEYYGQLPPEDRDAIAEYVLSLPPVQNHVRDPDDLNE